jgi:hypothetical protein
MGEIRSDLVGGPERVGRSYRELSEFYPGEIIDHAEVFCPVDLTAMRRAAADAGLTLEHDRETDRGRIWFRLTVALV